MYWTFNTTCDQDVVTGGCSYNDNPDPVYITRRNHVSVSVEFTMRFACVFMEVDLRNSACTSVCNVRGIVLSIASDWGHVKALRYKAEGRGFDPRWCHSNFSLT
jgi:hypothetical protein